MRHLEDKLINVINEVEKTHRILSVAKKYSIAKASINLNVKEPVEVYMDSIELLDSSFLDYQVIIHEYYFETVQEKTDTEENLLSIAWRAITFLGHRKIFHFYSIGLILAAKR